ncbi:MAG: rhomboid family intramembrane serine protease [Candidatus Heimdallarchaeota archaeon]|nr:rhomboid family intramembrane serine protease [Candidatus Heimdallarchaeota archaeon]
MSLRSNTYNSTSKSKNAEKKKEEVKGPTMNLFLINVIMYIITSIIGGNFIITNPAPIYWFGFSYYVFLFHLHFWAPFTSLFTHASIAHIGGNMIFLFVFGFRLEENNYSDKSIYTAYFLTGLSGSLLSMLPILLANPLTITVGASAAVFGLLGVNIGIEKRKNNIIARNMIFASIILFLFSVSENTNILSHFFGLLSGYFLGKSNYFERIGLKSN